MRFFITGYVSGSYGLDGTFKVKSASGESGHILRLREAVLRKDGKERTVAVERVQERHGCILMKVQGVDTLEAAKEVANSEIIVPESAAHKVDKSEWYVDDLCGCRVVYGDGRAAVGRVIDVAEGAIGCLLEVEIDGDCALIGEEDRRTKSGKARRVMIPFTDEHVGEVDTENKRIEMRHLWVLE